MRVPSARLVPPMVLVLSVFAPGCYYVTQADREEKETTVDQDNDGAPFAGPGRDCDDLNPDRSPEFADIPYDGIDNDCLNDGDLIDVDGDGFPGIAFEDWKGVDGVEWPASVSQTTVDCVDQDVLNEDGTVRFTAANIYPGSNPNEVSYDGIDADCGRDNDFDVDGDEYMPSRLGGGADTQAAFEQYVAEWGYEGEFNRWFPTLGTPTFGDCDDANADIYPGDQPDTPFDGIDSNCNRDNDFDPDGDGFMPPAFVDPDDGALKLTKPAFDTYVAFYGLDIELPADLPANAAGDRFVGAFDDCLEIGDTRAGLNGLDPSDIYPRAFSAVPFSGDDVAYDGVDTDCLADNDFDKDRDGYNLVDTADPSGYDLYVAAWEYETKQATWASDVPGFQGTKPKEDDCNDSDFATNPGALEIIGDSIDQDCDSDERSSAFSFLGPFLTPVMQWTNPRSPRFIRVDDRYVLSVATDEWVASASGAVGPPETLKPYLFFFTLDDARSQAAPSAPPYRLTDGSGPIELARRDTCTYAGASTFTSLFYSHPTADRLVTARVYEGGTFNREWSQEETLTSAWGSGEVPLSINLRADCTSQVAALSSGGLFLVQYDTEGDTDVNLNVPYEEAGLTGDVLFHMPGEQIDPTDWVVMVCDNGDCEQHLIGTPTFGGALSVQATTPVADRWFSGHTRMSDDGSEWTTVTVDFDQRERAVITGTGIATNIPYIGDGPIVSVDATITDGRFYLLVLEDLSAQIPQPAETRRIRLIFGDITAPGSATTVPLVFDPPDNFGTDAVPQEVSLYADADRIAVAVSAHDPLGTPLEDTLGWLFLGPPE